MSWLQEPFDIYSQLRAIFGAFIRVFRLTYTRAVLYEFNINIKTDKKSYFLD